MNIASVVAKEFSNSSTVSAVLSDRKRKHVTIADNKGVSAFKSLVTAVEKDEERDGDDVERQITLEDGSEGREGVSAVDDSDAAATGESKMVMSGGKAVPVPPRRAQAQRHVFDDLKDHFGEGRSAPNVMCNFKDLDFELHGDDKWKADVNFTYNMNGEKHTLDYVGMDVCIDLSPKRVEGHQKGSMNDYGKSWVYGYVPESTMDKVRECVTIGTGWDIEDDGTVFGHHRNVVAFEAKMDDTPAPSFWIADDNVKSSKVDDNFSRLGSIQEVFQNPKHRGIHRGVGIFAVSVEVDGNSGVKPTPDLEYASISFTLISIRSWSVASCVAPIVYDPRKMKANA